MGVRVDPQRGSAELSGGSTTSCGGSNPLTPSPVKYSPDLTITNETCRYAVTVYASATSQH